MSWFYSLITAFCAAGICFGSILIICPSGKTEKSVKYIISLCFLLIVISIAGVGVKIRDFDFQLENQTCVDTGEMETAAAEYTIALTLRNADIDFKEISVYKDNLNADGISCTKVRIYSECDKQRIVSVLGGEREDFEVEVINE